MRKLFFLIMAFALVGCGSTTTALPAEPPAATPAAQEPTVEVAPPAPTQAPTQESVAPAEPASAAVEIPASFNCAVFADMSASTSTFSLRCEPTEITFD